jgi:hypothetical protein
MIATSTSTGDPGLTLDRILGNAKEGFDSQVLFDPFEKQLHLPSRPVEIGDGLCGDQKVVGQEIEGFVDLGVVVFDPP